MARPIAMQFRRRSSQIPSRLVLKTSYISSQVQTLLTYEKRGAKHLFEDRFLRQDSFSIVIVFCSGFNFGSLCRCSVESHRRRERVAWQSSQRMGHRRRWRFNYPRIRNGHQRQQRGDDSIQNQDQRGELSVGYLSPWILRWPRRKEGCHCHTVRSSSSNSAQSDYRFCDRTCRLRELG